MIVTHPGPTTDGGGGGQNRVPAACDKCRYARKSGPTSSTGRNHKQTALLCSGIYFVSLFILCCFVLGVCMFFLRIYF